MLPKMNLLFSRLVVLLENAATSYFILQHVALYDLSSRRENEDDASAVLGNLYPILRKI